ncbi:MAG: hypothetical protein IPF98_17035 [Gemmatimonadetes bacterium]|nr:hypothetical protein [Gemmatimonadota bacterium]
MPAILTEYWLHLACGSHRATWSPAEVPGAGSPAARGAVDEKVGKASKSFRQELALSRERYSRDYQLFASKRNDVYAELYGHLENAGGHTAQLLQTIRIGPDFTRADPRDLRRYVESADDMLQSERASVLAELDADDREAAIDKLQRLEEPYLTRRAEKAWNEAKNFWIVHSLFLSEVVEAQMHRLNQLFAGISAELRFPDEGRVAHEKRERMLTDMRAGLTDLRLLMREEMQAGFSSASAQRAKP